MIHVTNCMSESARTEMGSLAAVIDSERPELTTTIISPPFI